MPLVVKDRVRETTTTLGTGTITLAGAVAGFQSFSAIGNANTTYYTINLPGANEWEVGIGTYTASGTTLSRDTILASSNGGSAVNFSAGTKDVFCTYPAGRSVYYDTSTNVTLNALTLSGGTANGVLYLDGSKVATTGSALTYNGTSFGVGSSAYGNAGTINLSVGLVGTTTGGVQLWSTTSGAHSIQWGDGTTGSDPYRGAIEYSHSDDSMHFYVGAAEKMRLASAVGGVGALGIGYTILTSVGDSGLAVLGNVGIGTSSPAYKLEVNGGASDAMSLFNSTNANGAHLRFAASGTVKSYIGGAPGFLGSGTADDLGIRAVGSVLFATNGSSVDMTIDSSGNLGLGVTPSAWYTSGSTVAQVRQASFYAVDNIALEIGNNAFLTSGGSTWNYINTGFATRYNSSSGRHIWYNAPSGTAGATTSITSGLAYSVTTLGSTTLGQWQAFFSALTGIPSIGQTVTATATGTLAGGATVTQIISFTQAMTLDASGNLLVGQTSSSTGNVNGTIAFGGADAGIVYLQRQTGTDQLRFYTGGNRLGYVNTASSILTLGTANFPLVFATDDTERARIDSSGNVGIGTNAPAYKLDVNGNAQVGNATAATNRFLYVNGVVNKASAIGFQESGVNRWLIGNGAASENGNFEIYDATNANNFVLTRSGNLGLGVTPSAWNSAYKVFQFGRDAAIWGQTNDASTVYSSNAFLDSGGGFKYISNDFASYYAQTNGVHSWATAASGTAGNAISFTQAMTLDASGNLVIGDTTAGARLHVSKAGAGTIDVAWINNAQAVGANVGSRLVFTGTTNNNGLAAVSGAFEGATTADGGYMALATRAVTSGTLTERARITSGGDVGIGTINPGSKLEVQFASNSYVLTTNTGDNNTGIRFQNTGRDYGIFVDGGSGSSNPLRFYDFTGATERARITSGGYFKASNDGTYVEASQCHELRTTEDARAAIITATNASYTSDIIQIRATRNTTSNSFYAIGYYNTGAAAYKFRVADSGDVTNTNGTYGTISDQKMKTDIVDAGSQWSDIKALRFRKFKMKDDPSGLVQLGVVAQEVELTSPGLVDEHTDRDAEGNDLGTTTKSVKTSILLMKAAVALQEAMARIETLEAEVAALKGA